MLLVSASFDVSCPHGRYAPSPTGLLHVGSARTALVAWLSVRAQGGSFSVRIEDLDGPRVVTGMEDAVLRDLSWLGLDWSHGPYRQSERFALYEVALAHLSEQDRLFPCAHSRKDLEHLATAPHGHSGQPPYPRSLRPESLDPGWYDAYRRETGGAALRFLVREDMVTFNDLLFGTVREQVAETTGDYVVKRKDGVYAYQLAVVVDDLLMGITEVVRGEDLLASTARQIQLTKALGGRRMTYGHVPLVLNTEGHKLSKRDAALSVSALREQGVCAPALIGYLGYSLGLLEEVVCCTPSELIAYFAWERLVVEPWILPHDICQQLQTI